MKLNVIMTITISDADMQRLIFYTKNEKYEDKLNAIFNSYGDSKYDAIKNFSYRMIKKGLLREYISDWGAQETSVQLTKLGKQIITTYNLG